MKKILVAVDDTKGSKAAVLTCTNACKCIRPDEVILLYVEKFEGRSLMDEMLGDAEMSTLKAVLEGTEYKKKLDDKADRVLGFYRKKLEGEGVTGIRPLVKSGHPAEEILKVARDEKVDLIVVGSRGKRAGGVLMGSVSREVANHSEAPVLIVK